MFNYREKMHQKIFVLNRLQLIFVLSHPIIISLAIFFVYNGWWSFIVTLLVLDVCIAQIAAVPKPTKERTIAAGFQMRIDIFLWTFYRYSYLVFGCYNIIRYLIFSPKNSTCNNHDLIIRSSLCLFITEMTDEKITIKIENVMFDFVGEANVPKTLVIQSINKKVKIMIDDIVIPEKEQTTILILIILVVTHPIVHSFVNRNYVNNKGLLIKLFSQNLNKAAAQFPAIVLNQKLDSFSQALAQNATLKFPRHVFNPKDNFFSKVLTVRQKMRKHFCKYKMGTDFEAYFICSFFHSMDHYYAYKYEKDNHLILGGESKWFIHLYISKPVIPFLNNSLKNLARFSKKWSELYLDLYHIDPEIADNMYMSVCL